MRSHAIRAASNTARRLHRRALSDAHAVVDALCVGMEPTRRMRARVVRLVAVPISALLLLSACSGADSDSTPSANTSDSRPQSVSASASTTTTTPDPNAKLFAAVRSFWDLYVELGGHTGPFNPDDTRERLEQHTTGPELRRLFEYFQSNAVAGYVVRGTIDVAPTVISVDAKTARVRDCYDDSTGLYRSTDGSRADSDDPRRHQVLMEFVLEKSVWKVSRIIDEGDECSA